jgi:putative copper export protein
VAPYKLKRRTIRTLALAAAGTAIIVAIAAGTNWRLAAVAALTAGAITLTRLRYAAMVAVALLAIVLALAQTGHSAGSDHRDVPARASHR